LGFPKKQQSGTGLRQDGMRMLREVLGMKNRMGAHVAVPIVGDGLNIQALHDEDSRHKNSWNSILRRMAKKAGISEAQFERFPQTLSLQWDILVQRRAFLKKTSLDDADLELGKMLAVELDRLERLSSNHPIYHRLASIWFENVISFNVDRRLATSRNRATFIPREDWQGDGVFYRHDLVIRNGCATRIWYPYGDSKDPKTFRFGQRWHAEMVMGFEDRRTYLMLDWAGPERRLRPPDVVYGERLQSLTSWYDLFFLAPLIFIGTKLRLEAWPVWWLLHQRARNFVPFDKQENVPPAIYLKHKDEPCPELRGSPCEIQIVEFESYDELWRCFFSACGA
jgi:hypothetical protein